MRQRNGSRLLALATLVTLLGCEPAIPTPSAPPPAASTLATPSPISSPGAATPLQTPAPTDQALANPGGTCTAAQLTSGEATEEGEPGAVMTQHVLVFAQLRNAGAACVLAQPKVIGLAADGGQIVAYNAPSLGELVVVGNSGHYVYPTSYPIRAGESFRIDINAYWWFAPSGSPTRPPEFPCGDVLTKISRAEVPLASGALHLTWNSAIQRGLRCLAECLDRIQVQMTFSDAD